MLRVNLHSQSSRDKKNTGNHWKGTVSVAVVILDSSTKVPQICHWHLSCNMFLLASQDVTFQSVWCELYLDGIYLEIQKYLIPTHVYTSIKTKNSWKNMKKVTYAMRPWGYQVRRTSHVNDHLKTELFL